MLGWLLPLIAFIIAITIFEMYFAKVKGEKLLLDLVLVVISLTLIGLIFWLDFRAQTTSKEIWSGKIIGWEHKEEWDEWHPPVTTCSGSGKNRSCTTTPGYWEHHDAENYIKTTDDGWVSVYELPNGKKMNDSYPNETEELKKYWKAGTPTASFHSYENRVKASYSVFKHEGINLEDFPDLPDYPDDVRDRLYVDRIFGKVPNKEKSLQKLDEWNTYLNKLVPDPKNKDKKMSYKQVNLIFVNVGENKDIKYGHALQDKWQGGNKNDFVVSFSMDKDGKVKWVYPFSWSEVEILKLEVSDYMMSLGEIKDFVPVVDHVSAQIEEKYERKEFSDFNYLHIDLSSWAQFFMWLTCAILLFIRIIFLEER